MARAESKRAEVERLIIIGSGPAGLTAAVYAARANLRPLVLAGGLYGGQLMLTTEVENYPGFPEGILGPELMIKFREQAERFGARIENVDVTSVDFAKRPLVVRTDDAEYEATTVIVATGASARWLDIPGEERLRGRGVSSCATCDGAFFREKHIVVVGGGDSALEEALFLTRFGRKVTIVHRRDRLACEQDHGRSRRFPSRRSSLSGTASSKRFAAKRTLPGCAYGISSTIVPLTSRPMRSSSRSATRRTPRVFAGQLDLDGRGYIASPDGSVTNVEGVFVAGDVND